MENQQQTQQAENHKEKLKWWHLFAGGIGLHLLFGGMLGLMLGDIVTVVGLGWGILLFIKYICKVVKKRSKK